MALPGSQRKLQALVEEHYEALYRYAYRLAGCATDAEDLTQEAFCRAQLNYAQLRDESRAKPWLFRILRNLFLHKARAAKNQPCLTVEDLAEVPAHEETEIGPIEPGRLQAALRELPELYRTPLILYYFDDFSYRDIAEQMDLPIGTVMSRLARAKNYLRLRLLESTPEVALPRRATDGL